MVVTERFPTLPTGSRQERTGLPSMWTVQAPHCAMPQPNFVPVIPSMSRNTQRSGISSGASNCRSSPLIFSVAMPWPPIEKRSPAHEMRFIDHNAATSFRDRTQAFRIARRKIEYVENRHIDIAIDNRNRAAMLGPEVLG